LEGGEEGEGVVNKNRQADFRPGGGQAAAGEPDQTWTHPVSGREVRFAAVTIERWYYTAQREVAAAHRPGHPR